MRFRGVRLVYQSKQKRVHFSVSLEKHHTKNGIHCKSPTKPDIENEAFQSNVTVVLLKDGNIINVLQSFPVFKAISWPKLASSDQSYRG